MTSFLYKTDYVTGRVTSTNMIYTPTVSGNTMCMSFDATSTYPQNKNLTEDLEQFFFDREVKYISEFQKYDWAARLLDIDYTNRKVIIQFPGRTLNHIMFEEGLDVACPNWKEQIRNIVKDISNAGYYKMALYPHCFFLEDNQIRAFDFYSCVEQSYPFVERARLASMIGPNSGHRFDEATQGDLIDFSKFFKNTMLTHLSISWKDNPFPELYKEFYDR